MYERMLNKVIKPTISDMADYIGTNNKVLFDEIDEFLKSNYSISKEIKFPFGKNYGWGIKYSHKTKHIYYTFPEKNSFTVLIQIRKNEVNKLYKKIDFIIPRTKELWNSRYKCGDSGWLHYRVKDID